MIRYALVGMAVLFMLHRSPSAAVADPVVEVGKLIADCGDNQKQAKCAAEFWSLADLTSDNKLTVAEITRLFRLLVEHQANKAAAVAPAPGTVATPVDPFEAVAVTFFVGPVAAGLVMNNFDYNGNQTIEREEMFADIDEDAFIKFVFDESKKLPDRAGMLMLRALQAGAAVRGPK